jgi:hypothetical protein
VTQSPFWRIMRLVPRDQESAPVENCHAQERGDRQCQLLQNPSSSMSTRVYGRLVTEDMTLFGVLAMSAVTRSERGIYAAPRPRRKLIHRDRDPRRGQGS